MDPLRINCGSCAGIINVPTEFLDDILRKKSFSCPHCQLLQTLSRDALSYIERRFQAHLRRHGLQAPGRSSHVHPPQPPRDQEVQEVRPEVQEENEDNEHELEDGESGETFAPYKPKKLGFGCDHPDPVVETTALASVDPPDVSYELHLQDLVDSSALSALQLESIVYACQRHQQLLADGSRGGFFIGDGAGVGKGRTIAGLILENWRCGRKRHVWLSIGSDLKVDACRDLADIGASFIEVHALNKLPYGKLASGKAAITEGVIFLTYASLISASDQGLSRLDQLIEWCGDGYDGLIIFDECHKAKNLVPDSGGKATKVGKKCVELQQRLRLARVVYCSATGASEPRNLAYMERLGLWGVGNSAFTSFNDFLHAIGSKGVGGLELVAMDMKARGVYVCRTLSFDGAKFEVVSTEMGEIERAQYEAAARMWSEIHREFIYAAQLVEKEGLKPHRRLQVSWRVFWATHQRFFRHMCMAAKVPNLVQMAKTALEEGKCVVIGLQSTGEARTADVVAERGEELDDFVSGPKELMLNLVEEHYPLPDIHPQEKRKSAEKIADGSRKRKKKVSEPQDETSKQDSLEDKGYLMGIFDEAKNGTAMGSRLSGGNLSLPNLHQEANGHASGGWNPASPFLPFNLHQGENGHASTGWPPAGPFPPSNLHQGENGHASAGWPPSGSSLSLVSSGHGSSGRPQCPPPKFHESGSGHGAGGILPAALSPPPRFHKVDRRHSAGAWPPVDPCSPQHSGHDTWGGRPSASACPSLDLVAPNGYGLGDWSSTSACSPPEYFVPPNGYASGGGLSAGPWSSAGHQGSHGYASGDGPSADMCRSLDFYPGNHVQNGYQQLPPEIYIDPAAELQALREQQREDFLVTIAQRKKQVKEAIQRLNLPTNPLDSLIDMLGGPPDIAEMTGRKARLIRQERGGVKWENRSLSQRDCPLDSINVDERNKFLQGEKLIAVISEAASAGISLHADRRVKNTRRRVHMTLELPWSADKAIQQFGRSHRANQMHGPEYRLLFTNLGGEQRFAAAVARRLQSLGALTQGDRRAGFSLSDFNFDSHWGKEALKKLYRVVMQEERSVVPLQLNDKYSNDAQFFAKARAALLSVGIIKAAQGVNAETLNQYVEAQSAPVTACKLTDQERSDVARFLNRLLGLPPTAQIEIFGMFQKFLEATIAEARKEGKYDEGIVDIKAFSIELASEPKVLWRDPTSGAGTILYPVIVDRGVSWEKACELLLEAAGPLALGGAAAANILKSGTNLSAAEVVAALSGAVCQLDDSDDDDDTEGAEQRAVEPDMHDGFYISKREVKWSKKNILLAVRASGSDEQHFAIYRPATGRAPRNFDLKELQSKYVKLPLGQAAGVWKERHAVAGHVTGPGSRCRTLLLLGGLVLPLWSILERILDRQTRVADRKLAIIRLQLTGGDGRRLVGVSVPEGAIDEIMDEVAKGNLGGT